jgi:nucleotide-binding universal stress UspA family protein
MYQRILVPLDGSACAEHAVPVAARIAGAWSGAVVLLRVVEAPAGDRPHLPGSYEPGPPMPPPTTWRPEAVVASRGQAEEYLASVAHRYGAPDLRVEADVTVAGASTAPAAAILAAAQAHHADLIVLCNHGRTGRRRWALGSTAEKVVHHAAMPVLLVREQGPTLARATHSTKGPVRALVPLDGSELAEAALQPAVSVLLALAAPGQAVLHLARVLDMRDTHLVLSQWSHREAMTGEARDWALREGKAYLSAVADQLPRSVAAEHELAVTWSVVAAGDSGVYAGDVAEAILRTAEVGEDTAGAAPAGRCDFIAMATHGQGGLQRWTMGSITERVLYATPLPMLIVRPHETAADEDWSRRATTNSQREH